MTYYEIFQRFLEVFIQLHPPPPSSLQPIPSSLQHPQRYKNQNIARNLGNSPNLGQKRSKSCPFCLKIGAHGILEVLIPNPDFEFWNSKPKINFQSNLSRKSQSCHTEYFEDAASYSSINFLNFQLEIHFWV